MPSYYRLAQSRAVFPCFAERASFWFAALLSLTISISTGVASGISFATANQFELTPAAETNAAPSVPVEFLSVIKGYRSGVREPLQVLIRNQADWLELWRKHADFNATPPVVLFDQEMVAAIFLGEKTTGGYDISIVRIEQKGEEVTIYYQETVPPPGSINTQAFTQPFHIVRFPNKDIGAKVTFRRES